MAAAGRALVKHHGLRGPALGWRQTSRSTWPVARVAGISSWAPPNLDGTVDERHPAPAWMVETLYIVVKANYQLVQNDWEYD